jgi:hypothetical protein
VNPLFDPELPICRLFVRTISYKILRRCSANTGRPVLHVGAKNASTFQPEPAGQSLGTGGVELLKVSES